MKNLNLLTLSVLAYPFSLQAEMATFGNTDVGTISISGNAELNINYRDNELNAAGVTENSNEIDQDGRLLVQFSGEKSINNGMYVGFVAQPLFNSTGILTLDDSYLQFGQKSNWTIRVGRFEAYDMFPKPQDVFVEYSGDTSNLLYQDNTTYSYQMLEARGRGNEGQIMVNKTLNNLYLEANFLLGDRSSLFVNGEYHGRPIMLDTTKDTVVARPVISYQLGSINLAAAAEVNLIQDTVVDSENRDLMERNGYAGKISWTSENYTLHAMYAYLDAIDETNKTIGITGAWKDVISLGILYSMNKYEDPGFRVGDVDLATVYGSYAFRNVFGIEKFAILLGGYFSDIKRDLSVPTSGNILKMGGDAGGRIRLFYQF